MEERRMTHGINYTVLMKEQFNLDPRHYFVFEGGYEADEAKAFKYMAHCTELKTNGLVRHLVNDDIFPMITTVLFMDQNKECIIKAISIRSLWDDFDEERGINTASYYALRHMKDRGVSQVKKESSIRTLINCNMNMTLHSVKYPELSMFELSLLQSKKSLVKDIQEGKVVRNPSDFNTMRTYFENVLKRNIADILIQ